MTMDNVQAKKLLTQSEYQLFVESLQPVILEIKPDKLLRRVSDARKLGKLWDARCKSEKRRAQQSSSQSARHRATTGHLAAREKAQLFKEVVVRFEKRLVETSGKSKSRRTRRMTDDSSDQDNNPPVWV